MDLEKIQDMVFVEYRKNGYLYMWNCVKRFENRNNKKEGITFQRISDIAELGLVNTEVSEAIEVVRRKLTFDIDDLGEECADIIIRVLNFMSRNGLSAEKYILHKHTKNMKRDVLHGKQV